VAALFSVPVLLRITDSATVDRAALSMSTLPCYWMYLKLQSSFAAIFNFFSFFLLNSSKYFSCLLNYSS
jgi:hypothetical protein